MLHIASQRASATSSQRAIDSTILVSSWHYQDDDAKNHRPNENENHYGLEATMNYDLRRLIVGDYGVDFDKVTLYFDVSVFPQ